MGLNGISNFFFWSFALSSKDANSRGKNGDMATYFGSNFDVLLTVKLSIILVINQFNAQNLVL